MNKFEKFKPGTIVAPGMRPPANLTNKGRRHIGSGHDYAIWHDEYIQNTIKLSMNKLIQVEFKKSKFNSIKILEDAISKSDRHYACVSENGNYCISFDMGYETGYDSLRERLTTCVTVVTKQNGNVVTVHPGLPYDPETLKTLKQKESTSA